MTKHESGKRTIAVSISNPAHATLRYAGYEMHCSHSAVVEKALALLAREFGLAQKMAKTVGQFANPAEFARKEGNGAKEKLQNIG